MEKSAQNYFIVFLLGIGTMITFHNTILSSKKYLTRNYGKVSDMLRIICNYGSLWRFILSLGYFMTPSDVTSTTCKALGYLYLIGYHLFHISLLAFLLWNLYRMSFNKKDLWIGIVLLLVQTSFIIPEMIFARPSSVLLQDFTNESSCELIFSLNNYRSWTTIILGFLIIFYVVVRLSYLAKNRKRYVASDVQTTNKTTNNDNNNSTTTNTTIVAARRPLNLSTIYLSLTLSILTFMSIWLAISLDEKPEKIILMDTDNGNIVGLAYKFSLYILISYLITYLDIEKRKNVIFYNCGGNGRDGSENVRNSANKLDGEAWVVCSKKERKKDSNDVDNNENNEVSITQV
ncbi:hypothetical protein C1645_766219 [Glomus cerebriforme]|uniref:Uncharacterized protein n=1 Tax=Glomus cerebriforme TaxID=658196 RepID=A0A397TAL8_9GLOM|nr:hypothetical protein C1645_766219 [Glomus cerebriforme]